MHPNHARTLIKEGAYNVLANFTKNREDYKPLVMQPPYILETWYRAYSTNAPYKTIQKHDSDFFALHSSPIIHEML